MERERKGLAGQKSTADFLASRYPHKKYLVHHCNKCYFHATILKNGEMVHNNFWITYHGEVEKDVLDELTSFIESADDKETTGTSVQDTSGTQEVSRA